MATGIQPTQAATAASPASTPAQQRQSPIGISAQQTTITPEPSSSGPFGFLYTIGEFFRSTCVAVLETINSLLSSLATFVRGGEKQEEPADAWMLPGETPAPTGTAAPTETPAPQTRPTPTETPTPNAQTATAAPPDPFSTLPIISDEKRKIFQIVHTLGTTNPIFLWPQQSTLEQLGREIEHVHPFKFLEYIILHPTLCRDIDAIRNSSLLWPRFLEGLANKLIRERAGLANFLPGFARSLQIPPVNLEPFLGSGNWEAMTFYIIDVKLGRITLPSMPQETTTPIPTPIATETPPPTETPIETPTAEPTAWQQLQLTESQKDMVAELVRSHRNMGYYAAMRGDRHVDSMWDRLDQAHPLAILTHLYTTNAIVTEMELMWPYRLHRRYFTSELIKLLNRRENADYLPHLADFTAAVRKDQVAITAQIHLRRWPELIEVLRAPSIE
ncbi:MAG: hypothetical protein KF898_07890 [Parachlamydiales bacterium]|nr:hypothetical protein [Verrucomicrobiota bacterium]MBX3719552.1 hypothetical protein [Candidatus Acheromyda pituitae]